MRIAEFNNMGVDFRPSDSLLIRQIQLLSDKHDEDGGISSIVGESVCGDSRRKLRRANMEINGYFVTAYLICRGKRSGIQHIVQGSVSLGLKIRRVRIGNRADWE